MESKKDTTFISNHSRIGWKDITSKHDDLADSNINVLNDVEEMMKHQKQESSWRLQQEEYLKNNNSKFLHLLHVLNDELTKESRRQLLVLSCEPSQLSKVQSKVWEDEINTANNIIQLLLSYKLIMKSEEADFILFTLKNWKNAKKNNKTKNCTTSITNNSILSINESKMNKNDAKVNSNDLSISESEVYSTNTSKSKIKQKKSKNNNIDGLVFGNKHSGATGTGDHREKAIEYLTKKKFLNGKKITKGNSDMQSIKSKGVPLEAFSSNTSLASMPSTSITPSIRIGKVDRFILQTQTRISKRRLRSKPNSPRSARSLNSFTSSLTGCDSRYIGNIDRNKMSDISNDEINYWKSLGSDTKYNSSNVSISQVSSSLNSLSIQESNPITKKGISITSKSKPTQKMNEEKVKSFESKSESYIPEHFTTNTFRYIANMIFYMMIR